MGARKKKAETVIAPEPDLQGCRADGRLASPEEGQISGAETEAEGKGDLLDWGAAESMKQEGGGSSSARKTNRTICALALLDCSLPWNNQLKAVKILYGMETPEPVVCERVVQLAIEQLERWQATRQMKNIINAQEYLSLLL